MSAYAASTSENWLDSSHVSATYEATPVELDMDMSLPKTFVTYAEAGGEMIVPDGYSTDEHDPADIPGPDALELGVISLLNHDEIPTKYHNSGIYGTPWTYDGSNPLSSSTRESGPEFSGH